MQETGVAMKLRFLSSALAIVPLAASCCGACADAFTSYFNLTQIASQTYRAPAATYAKATDFAQALAVYLETPQNFTTMFGDFNTTDSGTIGNTGWSISLLFSSSTNLTISSLALKDWTGYPGNVVKVSNSGTFEVVPGPIVGAGLLPLFGIGALALRRRKADA